MTVAVTAPLLHQLLSADHNDPFAVFGPHQDDQPGTIVRTLQPGATAVTVISQDGSEIGALKCFHEGGFFAERFDDLPTDYRLRVSGGGKQWEIDDPYRFPPWLGEVDIYLLAEGSHRRLYERLGAHRVRHHDVDGVVFCVWAPSAQRVAVVGDWNGWDGRVHPMRYHPGCGVWELFIPGVAAGALYKFEIKDPDGNLQPLKADPMAFAAEPPPATASRVTHTEDYCWQDDPWLAERAARQAVGAPISIYEVHLGSWQRGPGNRYLSYREIADRLIPYAVDMGFTHLEFMPLHEFPFDGSWGYQPVSLYAPTSRFGSPWDFQYLVDSCHRAGLGVLIDWVPGHFPSDAHGLAQFDGSHLYDHADPRQGYHQDWNTLIYNYGRSEVANFLRANARFWTERYHVDGLRVDAVASMLYLDYSRKADEWVANIYGGRENLEAISFLRQTHLEMAEEHPDAITLAEESTSWGGVTQPIHDGGLGFNYKWNMGWMHDTLSYMAQDPIHRRHHHHQMTFGLLYAFSERFVLPLSHDEVVHGKGSLLGKMPGDTWQKFANLRAYYGFMWTMPGKKLLFMGGEFAQGREWNHDQSLDWQLLDIYWHSGVQRLVKDLNHLYRETPALHASDSDPAGFSWLDADNAADSLYSYLRRDQAGNTVVVLCNFTPIPRYHVRLGVPTAGHYREILNSDAEHYGGSGLTNAMTPSETTPGHGQPHTISVTAPPLATVVFAL